jgi:hypothetical protein
VFRSSPSLLGKRWIGLSINRLLPVVQLGSEFFRLRLLSQLGAGTVPGELTVGLVPCGRLLTGFVASPPGGAACSRCWPDFRLDLSFPTNHLSFQ